MKEIIIEVPDKFGKTLKPEKVNTEIKGELVRCKDCKHWAKALGGQCNVLTVNGCAHCTSPDWFCADGIRKEQK